MSTRLNDHLATEEEEEEEQPEEELELPETIEEKTKKFERLHDSTVVRLYACSSAKTIQIKLQGVPI